MLFNLLIAKKWAENQECEITQTEKANGKFVILKIFTYNDDDFVILGSKNVHCIVKVEDLEEFIRDGCPSDIVQVRFLKF